MQSNGMDELKARWQRQLKDPVALAESDATWARPENQAWLLRMYELAQRPLEELKQGIQALRQEAIANVEAARER